MPTRPPSRSTPGTIHPLDVPTLQQWLEQGQAQLIDVREPAEYATERIASATLLPLSRFHPDQVAAPEGRKLVMLCHLGVRSRQACTQMLKSGTAEVWNLEGGMMAWKAAGLPVERGAAGAPDSARRNV